MQGVTHLLMAKAVRERSRMLLEAGLAGRLAHFSVDLDRLHTCAAYVAETIRQNYPTLKVPPHSRWRHFMVEGRDKWGDGVARGNAPRDAHDRARCRFDLAVTSVLLDAGAGPLWRWQEPVMRDGRPSNIEVGRSEGLALASLSAFLAGLFSSDETRPLQADAGGLRAVTTDHLAEAFLVTPQNPLEGLAGRVALLNRLGATMAARPDLFGAAPRIGGLFDMLVARGDGKAIDATDILALVLEALGPIWPARLSIDGIDLGDTWRHSAIDVPGPTRGLIPFHKLSQWLTYSLIEPLQEAGFTVANQDGLTGLAEYRNGGLFIDMGVIVPRDPTLLARPLTPDQEPIVEWRALTVALLDEIAPLVRKELGVTAEQMPFASILEGGTWAAGRRIAAEKRPGGGPPMNIVSDGTVF